VEIMPIKGIIEKASAEIAEVVATVEEILAEVIAVTKEEVVTLEAMLLAGIKDNREMVVTKEVAIAVMNTMSAAKGIAASIRDWEMA
jgi:ElaB/YqjD/DUF883 family membrane-anchored ribosome-binding protein